MRESERKSEGWATRRKEQAGPRAMAGPGGGGGGDLLLAVGAEVPLHEPAAPRAPGGKGVGGWGGEHPKGSPQVMAVRHRPGCMGPETIPDQPPRHSKRW